MGEQEALLCAYVLDGHGGAQELNWTAVRQWKPEAGLLWVHLDRKQGATANWLYQRSGLDPVWCDALLAEETRPRCEFAGQGALIILRGVNLNPGAEPEDMVSIRLWVEPGKVISLRHDKTMAVADIRESLGRGKGPKDAGDFLVHLASRLIDRMGPVIEELDDTVHKLEEDVLDTPIRALRGKIADLRRQTITLRRYLAPQKEVLARLQLERAPWLDDVNRLHLREVIDRLIRYVEDLDAARERAAVAQEELSGVLSEHMNKNMYVLSLLAAVFLPLGLLTGLLGINVGGIPGTESSAAFYVVCGLLLVVAVAQVWLFRRLHLF